MDIKIFKNIVIQMFVFSILTSVISFFMINMNFSIGVLVGGLLASLNFSLLLFLVKKIYFGEPRTQMIYAFLFMFKLSIIGGVIFWLFKTDLFILDKAGFLTGITILFFTITINALLYGNKLKAEVN